MKACFQMAITSYTSVLLSSSTIFVKSIFHLLCINLLGHRIIPTLVGAGIIEFSVESLEIGYLIRTLRPLLMYIPFCVGLSLRRRPSRVK